MRSAFRGGAHPQRRRSGLERRSPASVGCAGLHGGAKRSRTADLLNAIQALYQLSYSPEVVVRRLTEGAEPSETGLVDQGDMSARPMRRWRGPADENVALAPLRSGLEETGFGGSIMKRVLLIALAASGLATLSAPAAARDSPAEGMTVEDVVAWLQDAGLGATIETADDGSKSVKSSTDGHMFHVYLFDCKEGHCGSLQLSAGFDTKGAFTPAKMNDWSRDKRWSRAYVDKVNDPWVEYDVDLTPGGTYELLDDELGIWRRELVEFAKFIGW